MCRRKARPEERSGERGVLLTELAVSLPIFTLLLTFLAFALVWSFQSFRRAIADAELQQEMQIAAARIVESALLSEEIRERPRGIYEMRQRMPDHLVLDRYWLSNGQLVFDYVTYPITGAYDGAVVHITAFSVQQDPLCPRLYHIEMTGESTVTGRTYRLTTAVYLREDMGGT